MSACQHCGREHPTGTARCPLTGDSMQGPGLVGTRLDRYQIERLLGAGGFGAVYRARHVHTEAVVALKLLKKSLGTDQGMLERFLREARAAASLGSEHIVRVMDAGLADGQAFLALEFLDGVDLKELAAREGPLSYQRLVLIVLQTLEALEAAHARGIVHRDMKPANVFVVRRRDERGTERDFVKLLDFGISKMHGEGGSGLTMTGVAMGTPSYMAPEQFFDASRVDARADLYSVAAMLYELLTGRLPIDAESYAHLIVKVRTELPQPLQALAPGVPIELAQVVMLGLAKEPQQRWRTAKEMGDALRAAIGIPPPGSTPTFLPVGAASAPLLASTALTPPGALPGAGAPIALRVTPQSMPPQQAVPALAAAPGTSVSPPPAQGSGVTPPAGPLPPAALASGAPQKSSALKWVLVILGLLFLGGGCCVCGTVATLSQASSDDKSPTPSTGTPSVVPPRPKPQAGAAAPAAADEGNVAAPAEDLEEEPAPAPSPTEAAGEAHQAR